MHLQQHISFALCILFFYINGCEAKPLPTEILKFGFHFALLLAYAGGVTAIPHDLSTSTASHSPLPASPDPSSASVASPTSSFAHLDAIGHFTFSEFADQAKETPIPTMLARAISEIWRTSVDSTVTSDGTEQTSTRHEGRESNSEADPLAQLDELYSDVSKATKMNRQELHRLISQLPSSSKSTHESGGAVFPGRSFQTQAARMFLASSRDSSHHNHQGMTENPSTRSKRSVLSQLNSASLPITVLKELAHGHISVTTRYGAADRGNGSDSSSNNETSYAVPSYLIWREHLQNFARRNRDSHEPHPPMHGGIHRRSWYEHQHKASLVSKAGHANTTSGEWNWGQSYILAALNISTVSFDDKEDSSDYSINHIFRPFHEIELDIDNEPETSDVAYFEMTSENLDKSQVYEWYSAYSILRAAEFTEEDGPTEWSTFYRDFFDEPNFHCPLSNTECGFYDKIKILAFDHYKGVANRTIARRLLFVAIMQKEIHQLLRVISNVSLFANQKLSMCAY